MTTTTYDLDRELDDMANRELNKDRTPPPSTALAMPSAWTDRDLAMGTHLATLAAAVFSGGLLDIIVPAIVYVFVKDKSAFLQSHVRHQLNFQLTNLLVAIVMVVFSIITGGLGAIIAVPVLAVYFLVDVVCSIKACLAASRGEEYQFPFSLNLIGESGSR